MGAEEPSLETENPSAEAYEDEAVYEDNADEGLYEGEYAEIYEESYDDWYE